MACPLQEECAVIALSMPFESLPSPGEDEHLTDVGHAWSGVPQMLIGRGQRCCTDLPPFRAFVAEAVQRWNDTCLHDALLVSIDGLSGSGKSTLARHIQTVAEEIAHAQLYELPIDFFITTARNDPLRVRMTESAELFWHCVYSRESMKKVLSRVAQNPHAHLVVPVDALYDRPSGTIHPGTLDVPPGRKVVLVDGIDSTRILKELSDTLRCPQLKIFYYVPPAVALRRDVERDTRQGRRTLEENRAFREREYRYLVPQLIDENMRNADIVYIE